MNKLLYLNLNKLLHIAFVLPLCLACSSGDESNISTYLVERGNFQYVLRVDGVVEPVKFTTVKCPERVDATVTFIVDEGQRVDKGDTLCVLEDADLASLYDQLLLDLEEEEGSLVRLIASNEVDNATLRSEFKTNEAETRIAQLDSLQLKYLPPAQKRINELELDKVLLQRKKLEGKLKLNPVVQQTEVRRLQMQIQRMQRRKVEYEERLASLVILAPQKGMAIKSIAPMTGEKIVTGDNIWSGRPVITMPDMETMKVKIQASESNFNAINENDSIVYTFDAMPGEIAFGRVVRKNMAWKPVTRGSNVKMYELEASIDSTSKMPDPGFTTKCNVMLRELKDTIFVPQIAIFNEDSLKAVYVKGRKGFEMRQVITGLSSNKETVIVAGLKAGEEIAFTRPKSSHVKEHVFLPDSILVKYGEKQPAAKSDSLPDRAEKPAEVRIMAPANLKGNQ